MANLGISNASYYTDRFIHKINKEVDNSVNKLSTARENITASDVASLKSMDYTFRLDIAATNAAVKNRTSSSSGAVFPIPSWMSLTRPYVQDLEKVPWVHG